MMDVFVVGLRGKIDKLDQCVTFTPLFEGKPVLPPKSRETMEGELSMTWERVPEGVVVDTLKVTFQTSEVSLPICSVFGDGGDITFTANIQFAEETI